jgi:hypothetical protein
MVPLGSTFDHQPLNLADGRKQILFGLVVPFNLMQVFLSIADHAVW